MQTKVKPPISVDSKYLFPEKEFHCHMPFIFEGSHLIFCRAPLKDRILQTEGNGRIEDLEHLTKYQAWRIFVCDWPSLNNVREIAPDMPEASISCNPHAYRGLNDEVVVTYVSTPTAHRGKFIHKLWERSGPDFDSLGKSVMIQDVLKVKPYSAFENSVYRVVAHTIARFPFLMILDKTTGIQRRITFSKMNFLKRVSFLTEDPHYLILTHHAGRTKWEGVAAYESVFWDVKGGGFWDIDTGENEVYKCSIFSDSIVYSCEESTLKDVGKNYSMQLKSGKYFLNKSKIQEKVVEEKINPHYR